MPRKSAKRPKTSKRRGRSSGDVKLQRWVDLLAVLLTHRYGVPFEHIQDLVPAYAAAGSKSNESSLMRMFERDKDELRALGVPIEMRRNSEGEDLGYVVDPRELYLPFIALAGSSTVRARPARSGYRSIPTLTFEPNELEHVLRALDLARQLGDPELAGTCDSARRKLLLDLPNVANGESSLGEGALPIQAEGSGASLRELGSALLRRKRVTFRYHAFGSDETTLRTVEPFGLFLQSGHWYLVARDVEKDAVRNFRVRRISDVKANQKAPQSTDFEVPKRFRLSAYAMSRKAWELGEGESIEAVVEFLGRTGAARAAASLGSAIRGASRHRRFDVRRIDVFARWLLSFGGEARPLSPPALVGAFRSIVMQTLALYDGASA